MYSSGYTETKSESAQKEVLEKQCMSTLCPRALALFPLRGAPFPLNICLVLALTSFKSLPKGPLIKLGFLLSAYHILTFYPTLFFPQNTNHYLTLYYSFIYVISSSLEDQLYEVRDFDCCLLYPGALYTIGYLLCD